MPEKGGSLNETLIHLKQAANWSKKSDHLY